MDDNIGKNIKKMAKFFYWAGFIIISLVVLYITFIGIRMLVHSPGGKNPWGITIKSADYLNNKKMVEYDSTRNSINGQRSYNIDYLRSTINLIIISATLFLRCFLPLFIGTRLMYGFGALVDNSFGIKKNVEGTVKTKDKDELDEYKELD